MTCTWKKIIRYIAMLLLIAYLVLLTYLTFFSSHYGRGNAHRGINIIPLSTILQYLTGSMGIRNVIVNLAGNIVAFMPLGFLLPFIFKENMRIIKVIIITLLVTFFIETVQYFTYSGISDIDDILLNLLGSVIGYFISNALVPLRKLIFPNFLFLLYIDC